MAQAKSRKVALLPIKPKFANAIIDGHKTIEFRKMKFKEDVSHVVIYASSPVKKVIGYFEIDTIDEGTPKALWKKYHTTGGIEYEDFMEYYSDKKMAFGIKVKNVKTLKRPIGLDKLKRGLKAPQNFLYLKNQQFEKVTA